jgi:hypothetical protein
VRVKWSGLKTSYVAKAIPETDDETKSAIEFMAERNRRDYYSLVSFFRPRLTKIDS